jgi:dynactin 1
MTSESQQEINEETDDDGIVDNKSETDQEEEEEENYSNGPSRTQSTQSNQPVLEKEDIVKTTSTTSKTPSNQAPTYGSLAANLPVSKSEQVVPLKDYEELRLKLKILEAKRQEDREKYREHEKVKEEAEQFLTLRNKLQGTLLLYLFFLKHLPVTIDKIADLQKELRETKRQLKEVSSDQEMYESKYNDAIESLEMMTLDKEVAEERAENLQQEVNVLKDKIEEISVDLDVLRKEADIINRIPERDGDEKTPLEVIQLERHNERLKEALVRYVLVI